MVELSPPLHVFASPSPEATHHLGRELGRLLEPGHVVGLVGELGAGKTALAAGVAEGMGVGPQIYVSSPTFTLVNEYPGRFPLIHVDLFRIEDAEDLVEIGLDDYYRRDVACIVEWFDRFPDAAPPGYLQVRLELVGPAARTLALQAAGERHRRLGARWRERGEPLASVNA